MDNLKFEIGDFIKDMYRDDFLDFCTREIDKLRDILGASYLTSNSDSIERIIYDDFVEASFCVKNNLRFLRKEGKYSCNSLQEGIQDLCVILDVDGLDIVVVYEEGNIRSVEYQTSNGNVYNLSPLLQGYIEQYNCDKNINLKVLARLTVPRSCITDTDSYKTVKEIVCEKLSKGDFKDLEIRSILILDNVKEDCQDDLIYKSDTDTGLEYEEILELGGVEVDKDKTELNEFLQEVEATYKEDTYDYLVQGLIIIDTQGGTLHRYINSEISKYRMRVEKVEYVQRYNKIVPRCTLDRSIDNLSEIEFNSIADLMQFSFVENSEHFVTDSILYGLVPIEPTANAYWGILKVF